MCWVLCPSVMTMRMFTLVSFFVGPQWYSHSKALCLQASPRKQQTFRDTTTGFTGLWGQRNECRNSILMTRHYADLGSASDWLNQISHMEQPIKSTTQTWVVMCHQQSFFACFSDVIGVMKIRYGINHPSPSLARPLALQFFPFPHPSFFSKARLGHGIDVTHWSPEEQQQSSSCWLILNIYR